MNDLRDVLGKPYSIEVLRFLFKKEWVPVDTIAKHLNINLPIAMLYLSDLERVSLVERQIVTKDDKNVFEYKFTQPPEGVDLKDILGDLGPKISSEQVEEISKFYINLFMAIKNRVYELGGAMSVTDIVPSVTDEVKDPTERALLQMLQEAPDVTTCMSGLKQRMGKGVLDPKDPNKLKGAFLGILTRMLESNERFMGKLYGTHVIKSSTKGILEKNRELISQYDLLMGLPLEYFKMTSQ